MVPDGSLDPLACSGLPNSFTSRCRLLSFLVRSMLLAKLAVLIELQTIWIIFLILVGLIVTALAFRACQRNRVTHLLHPLPRKKLIPSKKSLISFTTLTKGCQQHPWHCMQKIKPLFRGFYIQWWRHRDLNSGHCGYEPHALAS